jgi:hypothetical protein
MVRVSPFDVTHKLSVDLDATEAPQWRGKTYAPLEQTIKHRSMFQRYRDRLPWEQTELFAQIYARRFAEGQQVRGCQTIEALAAQYYDRVDAMFADMKRNGFRREVDGESTHFPVVTGPGGVLVIGNNGNHRLAMAKVLNLRTVYVKVKGDMSTVAVEFDPAPERPQLHDGARDIPAMTTPAERLAYYELALEHAPRGEVVELGTWLGASTVFIAAGVRDSGALCKLQAYDRFVWQPIHEYKAGSALDKPMLDQVRANLGPLCELVELHEGEILTQKWQRGRKIALLIADGPKRIREISRTLSEFGTRMIHGGAMAWQDFAYFPAYEIPACLDRLERAGKVTFERSVFPGTTAVFRTHGLEPREVSESRFSLQTWGVPEIRDTWERWRERLAPGMRPRWMVGAALFMYDRGERKEATALFRSLVRAHPQEIRPKWDYLREKRSSFFTRYAGLAAVLNE